MAIRNSLELSAEIRRIRSDVRKWSLRELAAASGVPAPTIARIEEGGGTGYETVVRLAHGLGTTVAELIGESKSEDSAFMSQLRVLEPRLVDDRARETVLSAARAQAELATAPAQEESSRRRAAAQRQAREDIARSEPAKSAGVDTRRRRASAS